MTESSASPAKPSIPPARDNAPQSTSITSPRSLKQLSIFFLGAACFLGSTTITRKAIYRRNLRLAPKFYDPNTNPHEHFSPLRDAIQALNLATMNCVSLGIMGVGGTFWAFDTSGLREMRQSLRGHLGYQHFDKPGPELGSPPESAHSQEEAEPGEPKSPR